MKAKVYSHTSQGGGAKGQRKTPTPSDVWGRTGTRSQVTQLKADLGHERIRSNVPTRGLGRPDVRCSSVELRPLTFQQGTFVPTGRRIDAARCHSRSLKPGSSHRTAARSECPAAAGEESGSWCRRSHLPSSGPPRPGRSSRQNPPGTEGEEELTDLICLNILNTPAAPESRPPRSVGRSSEGSRLSPPWCPR